MNNIITLDKISKFFLTNKKITVLNKISYKFKKGKYKRIQTPVSGFGSSSTTYGGGGGLF